MALLFQLLSGLVRGIQPFLVPICFVCAWAIVIALLWGVRSATAATLARARTMHRIPCANCAFFTNDRHLKCPVRPTVALTEQAIGCRDFEDGGNPYY